MFYVKFSLTIAELMSRTDLHKFIREQGGAYGSGAKFNALAGSYSFYSFRDPNNLATLDCFHQASRNAAKGEFTDADVESAKLSLFSRIDTPVPSQNHGMKYFMYGLTDEEVQARRGRLLEVTKPELVKAAQEYLLNGIDSGRSSKIIFGTSSIEAKELESKGWTVEQFSQGLQLRKKLYEGNGEEEDFETEESEAQR
jgi:Zn-dependent M16 (insulinase) family peptidase